MNQHFAAPKLPSGNGRDVAPPLSVPANPYESFIAEKDRLYRLLIDAGIDEGWAIETAISVAMDKTTAKLCPDDYEFSPNVYGDLS